MVNKVMKVFYGENCLPYKDKSRTVIYPVIGSSFLGASNTTEIWFYFDKIGEPNNTWVAIAKLPNGKRGAVKLDTFNDTELNEPYAKLQLNTWFTQMRGDVYISLNGYDGGITLSLDQETGLYEVTGTPVIQATGSVKLTIQYATQLIGGDEVDEITLQEIYAMFGEKLDTNKGIVVIANPQVDISEYDVGQYFYSKSDNSVYEKVNNALTLRFTAYSKSESDTLLATKVDKTNVGDKVYGTDENGNQKTFDVDSDLVSGENGIVVRRLYPNGQVIVGNPIATNHATPKQYVDNNFAHTLDLTIDSNFDLVVKLLNANGVVISQDDVDLPLESIVVSATYYDTYTYQGTTYEKVLVIVLATTNVPTIIPIGDLVSGLVSTDELTTALSGYVEKVAGKGLSTNDFTNDDKSKLDGIEAGAEVNVIDEITINDVPLVPVDKSVNIDLTGYQEKLVSGTNIKTVNGLSLLGSGNYTFDTEFSEVSTNALENRVISKEVKEINYELAVIRESLFETVLTELDYTVDYATTYAIPDTLSDTDGTHRVVYSETALKKIEGNSFVYNQLTRNGNFESTSGWATNQASISLTNNVVRVTATANTPYSSLVKVNPSIVVGHKTLVTYFFNPSKNVSTGIYCGSVYGYQGATANTNNLIKILFTPKTKIDINFYIDLDGASIGDYADISNVQMFDLTQSDLDSVTTTDEAIAELLKRGINIEEYNPYNTGEIISSEVVKVQSYDENDQLIGEITMPNGQTIELKSAGSVHDTLEFVEQADGTFNAVLTRNVGSVDLGTLDWVKEGGSNQIFYALVSDAKGYYATYGTTQICSKYTPTDNVYNDDKSCKFGNTSKNINMSDSVFNGYTPNQVKQALSGVMLNYELETPTTETIATGLLFDEVSTLIDKEGYIKIISNNVAPNITTTFVVKKAVGE